MTQCAASTTSPWSVLTRQNLRASSHAASTTRVLNWMCLRRSSRSATKFMYASSSGCAANSSDHVHSCSISGENEKL
jgi:hypothetical protein